MNFNEAFRQIENSARQLPYKVFTVIAILGLIGAAACEAKSKDISNVHGHNVDQSVICGNNTLELSWSSQSSQPVIKVNYPGYGNAEYRPTANGGLEKTYDEYNPKLDGQGEVYDIPGATLAVKASTISSPDNLSVDFAVTDEQGFAVPCTTN